MAQLITEGEEIIPSEDEAKVQFEEAKEEGFQGIVCKEDFEVFYHPDVTEDVATTSTPAAIVVSANHDAIEVPEGTMIEKRVPDLLSLLESYAGDATPEIPLVQRPSTLAPPPQIDLVEEKKGQENRKWGCRRGKNPRRDPLRVNQGFQGHSDTIKEGWGGHRGCL